MTEAQKMRCNDETNLNESVTGELEVNLHVLNQKLTAHMESQENVGTIGDPIEMYTDIENNSITETVIGRTTSTHSRPPMTEAQKMRFKEIQSRTVFIAGHGDDIRKYFKHMPRKLNKEILEKTRGEVEKVFITKQGALKIIAKDEAQKNKLLKIQELNDKPVKASIPFSLIFPHVSNSKPTPVKTQKRDYFVKGVIYGLLETQENLNEIALEVGAHHITRLGNLNFSKAALVAYPKETVLPKFLEVDGRRYKINPYEPRPFRCDRCQIHGHSKSVCKREIVCSRCSLNHSYDACPDKNILRCSNCTLAHSAASKTCPVYIKIQAALKIRAEQNIIFSEAMAKVNELQHRNISENVLEIDNATYASKVKLGIANKTESTIIASKDLQTPTDVHVPSNVQPTDVHIPSTIPATDLQISSNVQKCPDDLVQRFLSFNSNDYMAINKGNYIIEDSDPITKMKLSFVLGVLSTIEKAENRKHAQYVICHAASELFFDKEIDFRYKNM